MEQSGTRILGALLVALGFLTLVRRFFPVDWASLWPVWAFLVPALGLHAAWAFRRHPGLLIPGGILLTYGLLFLYAEFHDYAGFGRLWPVFIAGPGVGQLEAALLGGARQFLVPGVTLLAVAGAALGLTLPGGHLYLGPALILLGLVMLLRRS